jgi:phosphatidylserine/phosphatidylglycerophosphate/cardiolipin synthase-like enzyme
MVRPRHTATDDPPVPAGRRRWRGIRFRALLLLLVAAWGIIALWHTNKPLPPGTRLATAWHEIDHAKLRLLTDHTVADPRGQQLRRQEIFDAVLGIVDRAEHTIVLDFFLFNSQRGILPPSAQVHRELSSELKERLLARKRARPHLRVLFVSDPVNDVYDGAPSSELAQLRAAGIDAVVTDLDRLRDSNWLYTPLWRMFVAWWAGDGAGEGWLPNPLESGPSRVTLRSWLELLNFKANHRKLIAADDGRGGWVAVVTSANPHDASSSHSNLGLQLGGELVREIIDAELAIARFSGWEGAWELPAQAAQPFTRGPAARVQFLTEGAIENALLTSLDTTQSGELISIAAFYLSDRDVIEALVNASERGVHVRLILDPNKDAFGRSRDGVPNRPVAAELRRRSGGKIQVRWYRTHGEQFHAKLAIVQRAEALWATLGSANLTRRNLGNLNLEANVAIEANRGTPLAQDLVRYFEILWQNDAASALEYTTDFPTYEDQSFARYWRYRLMEATGLSMF